MLLAVSIILIVLCALILVAFGISYIIYTIGYQRREDFEEKSETVPQTDQYLPYMDQINAGIRDLKAIPYAEAEIESFDHLKLYAKVYQRSNREAAFILMHGYRSSGVKDSSGIFRFLEENHLTYIIPDERGTGKSGGRAITMGAKEQYDVLSWIDYLRSLNYRKIYLMGVSMGATTVMLAGGHSLPKEVKGIIADCGYSSCSEILKKVVEVDTPLPVFPFYQLGILAAKLFARFDPDDTCVPAALTKCTVPVLMIHGTADNFVPCDMSRKNYEACSSGKKLLLVEGAGHGMSFYVDHDAYMNEFCTFLKNTGLNY